MRVGKNSETTLLDEAILEKKNDSNNENSPEKKANPLKDLDQGFKSFNVPDFPKEFRKPLFQNIDYRFVLCLLLSLLIHISIIRFIPNFIPDEFERNIIQKMHQRFVDTILEENVPLGSSGESIKGANWGTIS